MTPLFQLVETAKRGVAPTQRASTYILHPVHRLSLRDIMDHPVLPKHEGASSTCNIKQRNAFAFTVHNPSSMAPLDIDIEPKNADVAHRENTRSRVEAVECLKCVCCALASFPRENVLSKACYHVSQRPSTAAVLPAPPSDESRHRQRCP